MERERVEHALARIEAAAARIEAASRSRPSGDPDLQLKHERLRQTVGESLRELDHVIGALAR